MLEVSTFVIMSQFVGGGDNVSYELLRNFTCKMEAIVIECVLLAKMTRGVVNLFARVVTKSLGRNDIYCHLHFEFFFNSLFYNYNKLLTIVHITENHCLLQYI